VPQEISRVKIKNLKHTVTLEADLSNLNILIGRNTTEKLNFGYMFRFIKDTVALR